MKIHSFFSNDTEVYAALYLACFPYAKYKETTKIIDEVRDDVHHCLKGRYLDIAKKLMHADT